MVLFRYPGREPEGVAAIASEVRIVLRSVPANPENGGLMDIQAARTLAEFIRCSLERHGSHLFLAELDGARITYAEANRSVADIHRLFRAKGLRPGDRVALLGGNSINWALTYLATVTYGAVAVPILTEFPASSIHNIMIMSEARTLFVAANLLEKIEGTRYRHLEHAFLLEDFSEVDLGGISELVRQIRNRVYEFRDQARQFLAEHLKHGLGAEYQPRPEDLAAIVYTSGTTGHSKGVMLTHANIVYDVLAAVRYVTITPEDRFLSLLPLAHTYENSCGFLGPLSGGASIHYLRAKPSPKVLMEAFARVRPTMVFAVPLIMDKIYRKRILPEIQGRFLARNLTRIPLLRRAVYRKAAQKLLAAFGGELRQMGFGGAALSPDVERFMHLGKFPYFVGYGMTECAPLITGCGLGETRIGSCGYPVEGIELRIADPDPDSGIGEVQVRGPMVTIGYYKNPEATAELFSEDGWLRTGDLGIQDRDGYLYLKGRSKNMLLGPSGENIYPEEIEQLLNQAPFVSESLVVMRRDRLVALIVADHEVLEEELGGTRRDEGTVRARIDRLFSDLIKDTNLLLPDSARLTGYRLMEREFEKTPTQKIQRYLYTES